MSVFFVVAVIVLSFLGSELQSSAVFESRAPDKIQFKAFVFGISVIKLKIAILEAEPEVACLRTEINGKTVRLSLRPDRTDKNSLASYLTSPLFKTVDVKYMETVAEVGVKKGNFAAVMIAGAMRAAYCAFVSFVKSRQLLAEKHVFRANGNENKLFVRFFGIIRVAPANIIFSLFSALAEKIRLGRAAGKRR